MSYVKHNRTKQILIMIKINKEAKIENDTAKAKEMLQKVMDNAERGLDCTEFNIDRPYGDLCNKLVELIEAEGNKATWLIFDGGWTIRDCGSYVYRKLRIS